MSSTNNDIFTSSFVIWYLLFLVWLLWPGLSILCWIEMMIVGLLVPDQPFTVEHYIDCGFAVNNFYNIEICSFYTHFGKTFYHEWMLYLVRWFFCICWDDHVVFIVCWDGIAHWLICICWTILVNLGWILLGHGIWSFLCVVGFSSVQFSRSVVSDSLWPHEPQHAKPPCPSSTPGVHPNPCPLSRWWHPTTLSSVVPFSSCPQSFPASGSFPMSQLFASGGQSIGVSASTSVLPVNTQDWSPLEWTGWISLQSKDSQESSPTPQLKSINSSAFFIVQLSHPYMTTGKTIALTRWTFVGKVMSLLFNMLFRLVITFLPRSKRFLISWLQSPSAVILEPRKIKSATVSTVSPSVCQEVMLDSVC